MFLLKKHQNLHIYNINKIKLRLHKLKKYLFNDREEEERVRAEREAAEAASRPASNVRRRRGFEPPARDHCLLDAADEPEGDAPVPVPVRAAVSD